MTLEVAGHCKRYKEVEALKSLSFTLSPGSAAALLGPNGAGKSTAIKILVSLIQPDGGTYTWNGEDLFANPAKIRDLVGYVSQEMALDKVLTGAEFMRFCAGLLHLNWRKHRERAMELLSVVGLAEAKDRPIEQYSGGMKRRLDLASALLHNPRILVLDEPTTGLDIEAKEHIWTLIRRFMSQGGALILASHDFREVDELADYALILHQGEVAREGTPEDLRAALGAFIVRIKVKEYMDQATSAAVKQALTQPQEEMVWFEEDEFATFAFKGSTTMSDLQGLVLQRLETAGLPAYSVNVQKPALEDAYRLSLGGRR